MPDSVLDKVRKLEIWTDWRESPLVGETETALQNRGDGTADWLCLASLSSPDRRTTTPFSVSLLLPPLCPDWRRSPDRQRLRSRSHRSPASCRARRRSCCAARRCSLSTQYRAHPWRFCSISGCSDDHHNDLGVRFRGHRTGCNSEARSVEATEILIDQPVCRRLGFRTRLQHVVEVVRRFAFGHKTPRNRRRKDRAP